MLTDEGLLSALLQSDRLDKKEEEAFRSMLDRLVATARRYELSPDQRQWAERVYKKLELDSDEEAANLISSGKYKPTPDERRKKFGYEFMPRPLRPPGR